jgi:uncharacterized membrane protein YdjX (TVP38/TMEM64 family)
MTGSPPNECTPAKSAAPRVARLRLMAALALAVLLFGIGRALDLQQHLTVESLQATMASAGAVGVVLYVIAFCLGELLHVPGLVFVAAGVLAYGPVLGGPLAFLGAVASVSVSFWVVRAIGGRPLGELRARWVRRALAQLDARPVATIALLRLVLIMAPPLNYALALSQVRFAHYFLGSVLGLVVPIALAVIFFDHLTELVR